MIVNKNVRDYVKEKKLMISEKALAKLDSKVKNLVEEATERTISNGRTVVKDRDL